MILQFKKSQSLIPQSTKVKPTSTLICTLYTFTDTHQYLSSNELSLQKFHKFHPV